MQQFEMGQFVASRFQDRKDETAAFLAECEACRTAEPAKPAAAPYRGRLSQLLGGGAWSPHMAHIHR